MEHVVGLTGAFGSGCTTAAKHLRDELGFEMRKLSAPIREHLVTERVTDPSRHQMQLAGDALRRTRGAAALVAALFDERTKVENPVVVDGIRNVGEIQELRRRCGLGFTLFGILAPPEDRWDRIGSSQYTDLGRGIDDFMNDDARDRNEEDVNGQQVELCMDRADILIDNSSGLGSFKSLVADFAKLCVGDSPRKPTPDEFYMHLAYSSAHGSRCLKRNVGAVLVDERGQVIATGYNENPIGTKPCVDEPNYGHRCYRDIVRNRHFANLAREGARCPKCGKPLPADLVGPPWRCGHCQDDGVKTNLEAFFFPDRAMNWCTAIHAEVWALLAAGARARGSRLYTTTYPCFQCAEKLSQAGVSEVCFTEAYPDPESADRLDAAGIVVRQFQGVRSAAFERIFGEVKPGP